MNEQWMKLLVQLRKRYTALTETLDLTMQMGEALDRNDRTSFSMLLAMRQEPVLRMQELDGAISGALWKSMRRILKHVGVLWFVEIIHRTRMSR